MQLFPPLMRSLRSDRNSIPTCQYPSEGAAYGSSRAKFSPSGSLLAVLWSSIPSDCLNRPANETDAGTLQLWDVSSGTKLPVAFPWKSPAIGCRERDFGVTWDDAYVAIENSDENTFHEEKQDRWILGILVLGTALANHGT